MDKRALAGAALAAMTVVSAMAQDGSEEGSAAVRGANAAIGNRYYVSPLGSHVWEDSQRDVDRGWGGGLAVGKQLSPALSIELSGFYQEHRIIDELDSLEVFSLGASALVFPFEGPFTRNLYGIAGAHYGDVKNHPSLSVLDLQEDYSTVFGSVGTGLVYGPFALLNQGSIRVELLYRHDFHNRPGLGGAAEDHFGDVLANLGLLIPLGSAPEPPAPAEGPAVQVVPPSAPVDSDGDGVADDVDQCPASPAGSRVNEVGCPAAEPSCKTPEQGQPFNLERCATGDKVVLRGVNFEFDKSRLTSNAKSILDGVADAMQSAAAVRVEIGGHTDNIGSDAYNQKLSERRAASVREYLISSGIDAARMTAGGYGESEPVADNATDEGREANRRVELKITETPGTPAAAANSAPDAAGEAANAP